MRSLAEITWMNENPEAYRASRDKQVSKQRLVDELKDLEKMVEAQKQRIQECSE